MTFGLERSEAFGSDEEAPRPDAAAAKIYVGIATRGRPSVLCSVVDHLGSQTMRPEAIVVSCTAASDVGPLVDDPRVTVLIGPAGLARQRNAILDHLPADADTVVFFDDDFVAHPDWIAAAHRVFHLDERTACVTGHVVADGIKGPGLDFEKARTLLAAHTPDVSEGGVDMRDYSPYGCNMAFRLSAIRGRRFDERLVLYGWLEDRDFGGALARDGWDLLKISGARGVHMGVKSGRVVGRRLGYSQIANPIYMHRKGTMALSDVADHLFRNVVANVMGSFRPEPFVDRRGRLWGNMIAVSDVLRGRVAPERAGAL